jgi:putative ABC transport system substrate-binding protein
MREKILSLALSATLLALSVPAHAQQAAKVPRIGYLSALSPSAESTRIEPFRQGLRELGYVEGQNITIEYRFAEGKTDRLSDLAAELVRLRVDVIVGGGDSVIRAAKKASSTVPIVMSFFPDPVALGFVASLGRPGGNITGLSLLAPELGGKRLELLKEVVPRLSRVAVLGGEPGSRTSDLQFKEIEVAARVLGLQVQRVGLRDRSDLEKAFSTITKGHVGAILGLTGSSVRALRGRIVELAAKERLPAMYPLTEYVEAGGLMSYGPSYSDLLRRAAVYVDKILKGAKPADLPVEQPTKFELVINLKAAKQIGLTIPPNVLARADKVIK